MSVLKSVFLAVTILIYGVFVYLFLWRIFFLNEQIFLGMESRVAYRDVFLYLPPVIFLLYGMLLLGNLYFLQRKLIVFNSFFAASLLFAFGNTSGYVLGTLAGIFGLAIAVVDYLKNTKNPVEGKL